MSKKIDQFDVYVHDEAEVYVLKNQEFYRDSLRGKISKTEANSVNVYPETRKERYNSRKNVHVYLTKTEGKEAVKSANSSTDKSIAIAREEVDRVDMYGVNEKQIFTRITLLIVLLGLTALVIAAIVFAFAKASSEVDAAADGSSDGSSSDSGGSDSGGSDSGGSDSGSGSSSDGSGCYIATMAYGNYDDPQVMVLRRFRDRFLAKYSWGNNFIRWYYRNSPAFVEKHKSKTGLHFVLRQLLNIVVCLLRPFYGK